MTLVRALVALTLALAVEILLGRFAPVAYGYTDILLVPVAWYALKGSQRSAMLVGCAGGLLHDAWFQAGVFGMGGFKKTFLGWLLGGLATRLDLNHTPGRLALGAALSGGDQLLEVGLYRLLDLRTGAIDPARVLIRAALSGMIVAVTVPIVDRVRTRDPVGRSVRRGA